MFYCLKKKALLGLCFGALLGLTITTATEVFAGAPQISAGRAHSLTLDVYGTASAWGENLDGQGVAPVPATGYVRIAAGSNHNLAIKADGTLVEWGFNVTAPPPPGFGLPLPTAKPVPLTGVIDVAGGALFSAALLDTYTVVAWGDNSAGQTNVPAGLTGVSAIAAGDAHILALKSNGTVVGWGDDTFSQATGGAAFTGIVAVAAGSSHSLALKSNGTVVAWGDNTNGQTTIPAGLTGVTAIAANGQYSMALKSDGTVVVWGISTGMVNVNVVPAVLTNPATANVIAIAAGASHAMALINDGTVVAWGDDSSGQVAGATGVNLGVVAAPADTTPPVITLNGTTPVIHSVGTPYIDAGATVTDDVDATINNLAGVSTVVDSAVGNYTVTYDHSDAAGNAAVQKVRTVNVVDQTPPVITINGSNPATTEGGFVYTDAGATVTDNVDATITNLAGVSNVNIGAVGSYSVTYNHTDAAANVAVQKVRTVNVVDTTAPIIGPLADIYAEATAQATPVTLTTPASIDISAVTFTQDAPAAGFPLSSTVVTWTATDSYSNVSTATQNVVISDTIAPVINGGVALADVYAAVTNTNGLADAYTAISLVAPNATDLFGTTVSSNAPAAGFLLGSTVVIWTAADGNGNTSAASQNVIVQDKTAPVIRLNLPTDPYQIPVGIDTIEVALGAAYIDAGATVTDNVDAAITNLVGVGAVNTSAVGSYTITYNHSDAAGNAAAPVVRTVNVVDRSVDTTPPVISLNTTTARIQQVAAGAYHSLALKTDGTVVAWGYNRYNQTNVPPTLTGVTAIAAGGNHSLALKNDGTVVAWGSNGLGQATVPTGLTGVKAIAAGGNHSLALKNDGTVVAWGSNAFGQSNVPTGLTGVTAIATGSRHSLALKKDGTIVGWGGNDSTQAEVPFFLTGGVTAIAAGNVHSIALKNDGTVVQWGNISGFVPAGLTGVTAIAAGFYYRLALKNDGTVVQWGDTSNGVGTVPAGLMGVKAISAGGYHSLALKLDGTVVAWGKNADGQTDVPKFTATDFTLTVGQTYTDPGATVTDNKDGTISTNLKGVGKVDTSKVGVYKVTYNAKDAAGNAASEVVRTVTVKAAAASSSSTCGNIVPMLNMKLMPMYALMLLGMLGLSRRRKT